MADEKVIYSIEIDSAAAEQSVDNLTKSIEGLKIEQSKLKKELEEGTISQTDYAKAVEFNRQQLNKENAERKNAIKILQSEENSREGIKEKIKLLIKERDKLDTSNKKELKQIDDINKKLEKQNDVLKKTSSGFEKQKMNIGNYASAVDGLGGSFGNAVRGVQDFGKSLLTLLANPIVLIITAIVGAVVALGKAFMSTDSGATEFAARWEQIKTIVSVVIQRLSGVAEGIRLLFKGEWKEAASAFKEAFVGIGDQLKAATKAAYDYQYALDAIGDSEINFVSERAKAANKIAKLEFLAADQSKTTEQRRNALKEAIRLGEELVKREKDFADQRYNEELKFAAAKYNVNEELLKQFIESDDAAAQRLMENNQSLADARNKFGDDYQKNLEELYATAINLDTKYFEENKRNQSKLSGFEKDLAKQSIATVEETLNYDTEKQKESLDKQLDQLDAFNDEKYQKQVEANLKEEEENDRKRQAEELKEKETAQRIADEKKAIGMASLDTVQDITNSLLGIELNRIEEEKNASLNAEGVTEKEKLKIQKDAAKKQKKISIAQALINGALAIIRAFSDLGPILGTLAAVGIAAVTAYQIDTINSQQFARGGEVRLGSGGEVRSGVFGGNPHSSGGTQLSANGVPIAEVEKDERFFVVNKRDSAAIAQLSAINSMHGRPFSTPVQFAQTGGEIAANVNLTDEINNALQNLVIVTRVTDINNVQATNQRTINNAVIG